MNARARTALYAEASGLSQRRVNQYRTKPVNHWTSGRDRRIGGTIRSLERIAADDSLAEPKFVRIVKTLLREVHHFIVGVTTSIAALAEALASAVERISKALKPYQKVLEALGELIVFVLGRTSRPGLA